MTSLKTHAESSRTPSNTNQHLISYQEIADFEHLVRGIVGSSYALYNSIHGQLGIRDGLLPEKDRGAPIVRHMEWLGNQLTDYAQELHELYEKIGPRYHRITEMNPSMRVLDINDNEQET